MIEAGLPNINGSFTVVGGSSESNWITSTRGEGAFYDILVNSKKQYFAQSVSNSNGGTYSQSFDASRSNPIYGRSDTVQPNSIIINVWKRIE